MKIILISLAVIVAVAAAFLFSKVWVISDVVLNNFNAETKLKIKILTFFAINYNSDKKPKEKKKKEKKKSEKKVTFKDINEKKESIFKAIPILCDLIRSAVKINYFETDITVALADPMDTGLAYAAVMSAANIFYKSVKMKKCFLDVKYDFESEAGLMLKHKSKIYIRPISILKAYFKYKSEIGRR